MENLVSNTKYFKFNPKINGSQWRFARTGTSNPALRTPHYYGQFALPPGERKLSHFL